MNIYFCKRGEEHWEGGLIINAESKESAKRIFIREEENEPTGIIDITPQGEGVIYNDELR